MKTWWDVTVQACKVFVLFVSFTVLFYCALLWVYEEYQNYHRYDVPEGSAVKVANMVHEEEKSWIERLVMFYHNGE
ncbi:MULTISPECIES: YqzK family protein [Priestia]|uniref:Uncharacterized protein n=3 Tax=Priestia TaxID=2800373 RepID=A0A0H4KNV8_9BACI|nr:MULTISPECIES: YqzK family protein [Priestia]AKO94034.1 hypothetical protein BEH_19230 [Priestia filamentosa]KAB2493706.1 DUF4227 family protein [Priestia endophytica]KYG35964.1 hypothetical protein AZF06_01840 [Priestia endophytica]MBG9814908.1 membrane protein [Priestia endophytica]MCM3539489.1 YqzK family protein [Priestia endophytica]